jgi:hypothetical protein
MEEEFSLSNILSLIKEAMAQPDVAGKFHGLPLLIL